MSKCSACGGAGWVLDCNTTCNPVSLELLPCVIPDCPDSGKEVVCLSVNHARLTKVHAHPSERYVMSLTKEGRA